MFSLAAGKPMTEKQQCWFLKTPPKILVSCNTIARELLIIKQKMLTWEWCHDNDCFAQRLFIIWPCIFSTHVVKKIHSLQISASTQPPIQWKLQVLSLGVKRLEYEAAQLSVYTAEVKNVWSYTSSLPYIFTV